MVAEDIRRVTANAGVYDAVSEIYRRAFREHGNSVHAVLWPRDRQDLRFAALTRFMNCQHGSILDYGCGLAHLKTYLDSRGSALRYHGVDLLEDFIAEDRRRFPDVRFEQVADVRDVTETFDYVALSGVFNVMYTDNVAVQEQIVRDALRHLFARCRIALAVNFMTDRVDYRQPRAYHQNPDAICAFIRNELTARLILDQSYMPYEYTVTAFVDQQIVRPDNVYRS